MNTKKKILLSGARAPSCLELARLFKKAGYEVITTDCIENTLAGSSSASDRFYFTPRARQEPEMWIKKMESIIVEEKIDLYIPTCEEVFYASRLKEIPSLASKVFTSPLSNLNLLHNKFSFNQWISPQSYVKAPTSYLIEQGSQLQNLLNDADTYVFKPVYSRFAARMMLPRELNLKKSQLIEQRYFSPWILQKYIPGFEFCSYSICIEGKVTANVFYKNHFKSGQGAGICFETIEMPKVFNWIQEIVLKLNYTGQIAFDFIQNDSGLVYVLECNPRATSGIHFLADLPGMAEKFFETLAAPLQVIAGKQAMVGLAMLTYGMASVKSWKSLLNWYKHYMEAKETVLNLSDVKPFLAQFKMLSGFLNTARKNKISVLEATTYDIEWNGP